MCLLIATYYTQSYYCSLLIALLGYQYYQYAHYQIEKIREGSFLQAKALLMSSIFFIMPDTKLNKRGILLIIIPILFSGAVFIHSDLMGFDGLSIVTLVINAITIITIVVGGVKDFSTVSETWAKYVSEKPTLHGVLNYAIIILSWLSLVFVVVGSIVTDIGFFLLVLAILVYEIFAVLIDLCRNKRCNAEVFLSLPQFYVDIVMNKLAC